MVKDEMLPHAQMGVDFALLLSSTSAFCLHPSKALPCPIILPPPEMLSGRSPLFLLEARKIRILHAAHNIS